MPACLQMLRVGPAAAVKVVTFLTMPLEAEAENQGLQVVVLLNPASKRHCC